MARSSKIGWTIAAVFTALVIWLFTSDAITDSATRLAYDIEEAAARLRRSGSSTFVLVHRPKASPSGCEDAYKLQLSQQSSLLIWCLSPDGTRAVSSHTTTYHLRFVDVPQQINLEKRKGDSVTIELQQAAGKPAIVRAH